MHHRGARLAGAGNDVTFIARGAHLAAMREGGLTLVSPNGDLRLETVNATDEPSGLGPMDVVLVTVKLYDLAAACDLIAPIVGPQTMIVPIQNGVSAAEIEAAVVNQVRALLRQPEVVVGTWLAARAEAPDLKESEVRDALTRLDPLWGELFPAEQARIVRALVERVVVGPAGADIRLRVVGLAGLVRDLTVVAPEALKAAA